MASPSASKSCPDHFYAIHNRFVRRISDTMPIPKSIHDYLVTFGGELGERTVQSYAALHDVGDPISPRIATLLRKPFPAQIVATMGVVKKWQKESSAAVVAECGTGKTLISLASVHVHSEGRPFTAIVMAPGHITLKWCKEALETIPRLRVFLIDGIRDRVKDSSAPSGVNEVKLRRGQIVREGLHTTLTELRLRKGHKSARARWHQEFCSGARTIRCGPRQRQALALLEACIPCGAVRPVFR
jgi:hypothetical protein